MLDHTQYPALVKGNTEERIFEIVQEAMTDAAYAEDAISKGYDGTAAGSIQCLKRALSCIEDVIHEAWQTRLEVLEREIEEKSAKEVEQALEEAYWSEAELVYEESSPFAH